MRRRRKTKYTWLPIQNGATFGGEDVNYDRSNQNFILDVPPDGNLIVGIIPVVADLPQGTLTTVETEGIGEIVGNEYVLKRITGSCFCSVTYQNADTVAAAGIDQVEDAAVIVTCAFFVARADPANLLQPISGSLEGQDLYGPQVAELTRQPWIWRRQWILGAGGFGPGLYEDLGGTLGPLAIIRGRGSWPSNNAAYGSIADGPKVEAKTGRRIRLEDRLWFVASAAFLNPTGTAGQGTGNLNTNVEISLDCRYLGALRRPRGRSNFA